MIVIDQGVTDYNWKYETVKIGSFQHIPALIFTSPCGDWTIEDKSERSDYPPVFEITYKEKNIDFSLSEVVNVFRKIKVKDKDLILDDEEDEFEITPYHIIYLIEEIIKQV